MAKKKPSNLIIDGLSTLLAGFKELEDNLSEDYETESEEELSSAIINELSTAVDAIIDQDEYSPAFIASVVSSLTEALKELDPEIFESAEEDEEDDDDESDDDLELSDDDEYYEGH